MGLTNTYRPIQYNAYVCYELNIPICIVGLIQIIPNYHAAAIYIYTYAGSATILNDFWVFDQWLNSTS
jgi:hypothetical protein